MEQRPTDRKHHLQEICTSRRNGCATLTFASSGKSLDGLEGIAAKEVSLHDLQTGPRNSARVATQWQWAVRMVISSYFVPDLSMYFVVFRTRISRSSFSSDGVLLLVSVKMRLEKR